MNKIVLILGICSMAIATYSQAVDTAAPFIGWKQSGLIGIKFSQATFTNWATGGQNNYSVSAIFSYYPKYKNAKNAWDNAVEMAIGYNQNGKTNLRKNEDKIDLTSVYGRYAFKKYWYYAGLLNFKSIFANAYNYPNDTTIIGHFLAPGYFIVSIGLEYKPTDYFSCLIAPFSFKETVVDDQRLANTGAYGVEPAVYNSLGILIKNGKTHREEFGSYLRFFFKKDIIQNVNFSTKLELYSNYFKNPQNVDIYWEIILGMRVNNYLSVVVTTNMVYDDDIPIFKTEEVNGVSVITSGPRLQFKEVWAVGFNYKF